ncbi:MAG: hypothetical protein CM15mV127_020 [Caudoviricetes sp.]|nr:MAG: hypothetical protein CM15mV127_020 [Caudoviricetes sp.]
MVGKKNQTKKLFNLPNTTELSFKDLVVRKNNLWIPKNKKVFQTLKRNGQAPGKWETKQGGKRYLQRV